MAGLVHAEVFQPQRRPAAMKRLGVDKAHLTRLIVKCVAFEAVSAIAFKSAVYYPHRIDGHEPGLAVVDDKRGVANRKPFGQIAVMGQQRAAVADGKDCRDQLDIVVPARLADFVEAAEVVGSLHRKSVEAERHHGPVDAVFRRRVEKLDNPGRVAVAAQIPSEDPNEAVLIFFGAGRRRAKNAQTHRHQHRAAPFADHVGTPFACHPTNAAVHELCGTAILAVSLHGLEARATARAASISFTPRRAVVKFFGPGRVTEL